MNKVCRKLKQKYKFKYDINAILSDLIYTRILDSCSKRSSFRTAHEFLEKPSYELHDVYRALDVLGSECDLIQADVYKNSHFPVSYTHLDVYKRQPQEQINEWIKSVKNIL